MANCSLLASTSVYKPEAEERNGLNDVSLIISVKVKYYCFIIIDTKVSEKVSSLIQNKRFCSDVKKMSPTYQTNACEAFHSVVNHFAPKSTAFSYKGMCARYALQFSAIELILV